MGPLFRVWRSLPVCWRERALAGTVFDIIGAGRVRRAQPVPPLLRTHGARAALWSHSEPSSAPTPVAMPRCRIP